MALPRPFARHRVVWALVGLVVALLIAGPAAAAVFVPPPPGWEEGADVSPAVQAKAKRWAEATGANLVEVMGPSQADEFAETLAVLEIRGALAEAALADPEVGSAALSHAAKPIIGTLDPPEGFSVAAAGPDQIDVLKGHWTVNDVVYHVALAPSGPSQSLIVLVFKARESSLYARTFENLLAEVTGVTAPVAPFPHNDWLLAAAIIWVLLGGVIYMVVDRSSTTPDGRETGGRKAGTIMFLLSFLAAAATYFWVGDYVEGMRLIDLSREWVALEIGAIGLVVTLAVILLGGAVGRRRVVQSAPTGGSFAGRGTAPKVPRLYDPAGVELVKVDPAARRKKEPEQSPAADEQVSPVELPDLEYEPDELPELAPTDEPANLVEAQPSEPVIDLDVELPDLDPDHDAAGVPESAMADHTPIPSDSVHGEYSLDLDSKRKRKRKR